MIGPLLLLTALVAEVRAAETGDIRGELLDADGLPVPGARITVDGPNIAGTRSTTTDDNGRYRLDGISPGLYELNATLDGATLAIANVTVALDRSTWVPLTAFFGAVETIQVVDAGPIVDTTRSGFSARLSQEALQNMPVGRSYQDAVNIVPGVSGRVDTSSGGPGDGNPSVRGEGQYGNNFTLDGVMTRDPATKTWGQDVNFDAIEEIEVYTDGAPAEFGQFTGMMVNVVTKDGGDEHHGSVAAFYSQHAWFKPTYSIFDPETGVEAETTKRRSWAPVLNATFGGPIVKEKLWYFGAIDLDYSRGIFEGGDESAALESWGGRALGKFTWFATPEATLRYNFIVSPGVTTNEQTSSLFTSEAQTNRNDLQMSHTLTATIKPDENTEFVARAGVVTSSLNVVPASGDPLTPNRVDGGGVYRDNATDFDFNQRLRFGGGVSLTKIVRNFAGDHEFKAGLEYWGLETSRDLVHTGETTIEWIDTNGNPTGTTETVGTQYLADASRGLNCAAADYSDCGFIEHRLNVGPLRNFTHTGFAYLQDEWRALPWLTFNLGVRADLEGGLSNDGTRPNAQDPLEFTKEPDDREVSKFGPFVVFAPRLGFAWDATRDNKTAVTAHYGWYYDVNGSDFWDWSNTRSADGFVRLTNDGSGNFVWNNTQDAVGNPLIYAKNLKPARLEKFNFGVERQIANRLSVGVRGILSRTNNIPEDLDVNFNDWYVANSSIKQRLYHGLELTINKQFDDRWQLMGSYTLSRSMGHMPGQFELESGGQSGSNGNNVGVYLDDIGEQQTRAEFYDGGYAAYLEGFKGLGRQSVTNPQFADSAGFWGYLPYHAFHQVKLNGTYTAPSGTTVGAVYEFSSGNAWSKRTLVPFYGYNGFAQGRGTRFMPATHFFDVRIAQKFKIREQQSIELTLDIFNLLGLQTPITYYENDTLQGTVNGFGATLYRQAPRSIRAGVKFRY